MYSCYAPISMLVGAYILYGRIVCMAQAAKAALYRALPAILGFMFLKTTGRTLHGALTQ